MSNFYSGNNITIENLGNSKAKINKIGMSWQETRSGKNIFDGKLELGIYSGSTGNKSSNDSYVRSVNYIPVKELTNYRISSNGTGISVYVYEYKEDYSYNLTGAKVVNTTQRLTTEEGTKYITFRTYSQNTDTTLKIQIEEGTVVTDYEPYGAMPSPEFPSEIKNVTGSANITVCNENLVNVVEGNDVYYTKAYKNYTIQNGKVVGTSAILMGFKAKVKPNTTYMRKGVVSEFVSGSNLSIRIREFYKEPDSFEGDNFILQSHIMVNNNGEFTQTVTTSKDTEWVLVVVYCDKPVTISDWGLYEGTVVPKNYISHQSQQFTFPLAEGQRMYKDSYLADDGVHHKRGQTILDGTEEWLYPNALTNTTRFQTALTNAKASSNCLCNRFIEQTIYAVDTVGCDIIGSNFYVRVNQTLAKTSTELKNWLSENPLTVEYILAEEVIEPYTAEQENVYMQLQNIELYQGINHIYFEEETKVEISVVVNKLIEDYDVYISSTGRLIIPALNINYLIDLNESDIPTMPEAVESSVRAAGRDGDIVLNTTYEPIPFNIVCYTEDNLTLFEKVEEEKKINKFLNSIKNKTIPFALEKADKFYNVKYNGALTTINYPAHLKFSIPLKSSESYGKDLIQKSIVGSSIGESETEKEVGALFVLRGPAINPIVSLNDYSMEYNMNILEGARVEIDSVRSTITNINSDGIRTNVMKYYNHQFPKIENGINELKVLSGFDSDLQVSVIWNDLKL